MWRYYFYSKNEKCGQNIKGEKNEKVTFWNNFFGIGNCSSYSNDGTGRYTH
jgi:hypothetical protein